MWGGVKIGDNSIIGKRKHSATIGHFYPTRIKLASKGASLDIGCNVHLNGVYIACRKQISIGDNCRVAAGVVILDYNGHEVRSLDRTKDQDNPMDVLIGNNVWIGTNAIILKGTSIGDNCVVGAGSVVKGFFPPDSIIIGNPATVSSTIEFNH